MVKINFKLNDIEIGIDDEKKTSEELILLAYSYAVSTLEKSFEIESKWNIEPGDTDQGDRPKEPIKAISPDINFNPMFS